MKIFNIAYYNVLRNFRDRKSISLTLFFPVLLILILGTALNNVYGPKTIDRINVAYVNEDRGEMSKQFDTFLKISSIQKWLKVTRVNSYDKGMKLIKDKKDETLIYIKANYSKEISLGEKANIEVYQNQINELHVAAVKSIVDSFINGANTMETVAKMGAVNQSYIDSENIKDMPITTNGNIPRAIDYYAVTMLAMTLMYGTLFASYAMAEDKAENTYIRIKASPIKPYINYMGKTLGTFVTLALEAAILILFTNIVYHVNWGTNMPMILLLSGLFAIFATALGIFAYSIFNNSRKAAALLNIITVFFTFVSGGYAKIGNAGSAFDKLASFVPNKMFHTAMFNTIYGGSISQTQTCIVGLIGITVVLFIIASVFGRRAFN